MRAVRLAAVPLVALTMSCSALLVHPVQREKLVDGTERPVCATNSYAWPVIDTAAAAVFAILPILALQNQDKGCDPTGTECNKTSSLVILWAIGAPIWGGSAYFGYRGVSECREAGSPSRFERWRQPPRGNGQWHITPAR
jgi:hypothetical protein